MAGVSPTSRSLSECRKRGWMAYVCEKWIPQVRIRKDAFGFGDILAVDDEPGALLIQATVTDSAPKRVTKILEECGDAARKWMEANNRIVVWGWAKRGKEGKRKLWTLKEYPITREMLGLAPADGAHQVPRADATAIVEENDGPDLKVTDPSAYIFGAEK